MDVSTSRAVLVVAAVIVANGRVLVSQRPEGSHLAGMWEFPGGKVEPHEDPRAALGRELREELGIDARVGSVIEVVFHQYATKSVVILFFRASLSEASPAPQPLDVAACAWRGADELHDKDFAPADVAVLDRIRALVRQEDRELESIVR